MPTVRRNVAAIVIHFDDGTVGEHIPLDKCVLVQRAAVYEHNDKVYRRTKSFSITWEEEHGEDTG